MDLYLLDPRIYYAKKQTMIFIAYMEKALIRLYVRPLIIAEGEPLLPRWRVGLGCLSYLSQVVSLAIQPLALGYIAYSPEDASGYGVRCHFPHRLWFHTDCLPAFSFVIIRMFAAWLPFSVGLVEMSAIQVTLLRFDEVHNRLLHRRISQFSSCWCPRASVLMYACHVTLSTR